MRVVSHSRLLIDPILIKFRLRDDQTVEKLTIKWNNNIEKPNVKHRINPMRDLASLHKNNKVTEMSGSTMTILTRHSIWSVWLEEELKVKFCISDSDTFVKLH